MIKIEIIEIMFDAWPDIGVIFKWVVNTYYYVL